MTHICPAPQFNKQYKEIQWDLFPLFSAVTLRALLYAVQTVWTHKYSGNWNLLSILCHLYITICEIFSSAYTYSSLHCRFYFRIFIHFITVSAILLTFDGLYSLEFEDLDNWKTGTKTRKYKTHIYFLWIFSNVQMNEKKKIKSIENIAQSYLLYSQTFEDILLFSQNIKQN